MRPADPVLTNEQFTKVFLVLPFLLCPVPVEHRRYCEYVGKDKKDRWVLFFECPPGEVMEDIYGAQGPAGKEYDKMLMGPPEGNGRAFMSHYEIDRNLLISLN